MAALFHCMHSRHPHDKLRAVGTERELNLRCQRLPWRTPTSNAAWTIIRHHM